LKLPEDPIVLELLPEFVETWLTDIEQYHEFETKNQASELYRMAHTLKGSCYQFGLDDLGDMGIEMMTYAKISDWAKAAVLKQKIKSRFLEVDDYLINHNIVLSQR